MPLRSACLAVAALCAFAPLSAHAQRRRPPRPPPVALLPPPPPPEPPPPAPEPPPAPAPEPPPEAAPEPPPPPPAARHPRLDLEAQYRVVTRSLTWDGDETQRAFRDYDLRAASAFRIAAEAYPLAFVTDGLASHLGVTAAFGMALALDSQDAMGRSYETTAYDLAAGLRFRLPLAVDGPDVGLHAGWTRQVFYVRASATQALGGVPDLVYDGLRAGASARFPLGSRLALRVDLGASWIFGTGELGEVFFPRVSSLGFDGGLAAALRLAGPLEARLGVDVRGFLHATRREDGDRYQATGATDLYVSGTAGLALRW